MKSSPLPGYLKTRFFPAIVLVFTLLSLLFLGAVYMLAQIWLR